MTYYEDYFDEDIGEGRPITKNSAKAKARRAKYLRDHGGVLKHRPAKKRSGSKRAVPKRASSKRNAPKRASSKRGSTRKRPLPVAIRKTKSRDPSEYNLFVKAYIEDFNGNNPNSRKTQREKFSLAAKAWNSYKKGHSKSLKFVRAPKSMKHSFPHRYARSGPTARRASARIAQGFGY